MEDDPTSRLLHQRPHASKPTQNHTSGRFRGILIKIAHGGQHCGSGEAPWRPCGEREVFYTKFRMFQQKHSDSARNPTHARLQEPTPGRFRVILSRLIERTGIAVLEAIGDGSTAGSALRRRFKSEEPFPDGGDRPIARKVGGQQGLSNRARIPAGSTLPRIGAVPWTSWGAQRHA